MSEPIGEDEDRRRVSDGWLTIYVFIILGLALLAIGWLVLAANFPP